MMGKYTRDSVPDLTGKVALVTGGAGGIGLETVYMLARRNAVVYCASRNETRSLASIKSVTDRLKTESIDAQIHWHLLDLSSISGSVSSAQDLIEKCPHLDILIANAGVNLVPYDSSIGDGYETCMQTNHLGHFAFINTLLPLLKNSSEKGDVRVVITASEAHKFTKSFDYDSLNKPQKEETRKGFSVVLEGFGKYTQSKLANLLFMVELDRRVREEGFENLYVDAVDPGIITTTSLAAQGEENMPWIVSKIVRKGFNVVSLSHQEGAFTQTYMATCKDVVTNDIHGRYYKPKLTWTFGYDTPQAEELKPYAKDPEMAKKLWAWSEQAVAKALTKSDDATIFQSAKSAVPVQTAATAQKVE